MADKKQRLKKRLAWLAYHTGVLEILRFSRRSWTNILMYHRFSEKSEPFKISSSDFERQLKLICRKFNPIALSTYITATENGSKLSPNSIVITIDDGYLDNYTIAYPLLKKYNVPTTIFLATDFVDKGNWLWPMKLLFILQNTSKKRFSLSLNGEQKSFSVETFSSWHATQLAIFNYLRMIDDAEKDRFLIDLAAELTVDVPEKTCGDFNPLTWSQIREMQQEGIEFGSHTCTHPILSRQNEMALKHETATSKQLIEDRLQQPVISFCYPNGQPDDYNRQVIKAVQDAGYRCAVTTIRGVNAALVDKPYELKRKGLMVTAEYKLYRRLLQA